MFVVYRLQKFIVRRNEERRISIADFHPTLTRQILQKYRKDNFVAIVTKSLDEKSSRADFSGQAFPSDSYFVAVIEKARRENASPVPKTTDDERITVDVKFAT